VASEPKPVAVVPEAAVKQPQLHAAYHAQGFPPLRQAIAERLQARGMEASADDIVITAGSQQALNGFRLGYAMLSQDDMRRGIEILADVLHQEIARR
jgi:DNA-binding transcriptional MocR family regulator